MAAAAAQAHVERLINANAVVVFTRSMCPFCDRVEAALEPLQLGAKLKIDQLDSHSSLDGFREFFRKTTGEGTFPRVYVRGTCIGGCTETLAALKNNSFQKLLAA